MPATPLDAFLRSLENLDYTRKKTETLYRRGKISRRDLHFVYEGLFLRAVAGFEVYLEDLFILILNGKSTYPKGTISLRVTPSSPQALRTVLLQGRPYQKWLPYENTEARAKVYLDGGGPFSRLKQPDKDSLAKITKVRNAIAHRSPHAMSEFSRTVVGAIPLMPGERNPAGFLRYPVTPKQTKFEVYVLELAGIATALG